MSEVGSEPKRVKRVNSLSKNHLSVYNHLNQKKVLITIKLGLSCAKLKVIWKLELFKLHRLYQINQQSI
jgi:hypothetical protein